MNLYTKTISILLASSLFCLINLGQNLSEDSTNKNTQQIITTDQGYCATDFLNQQMLSNDPNLEKRQRAYDKKIYDFLQKGKGNLKNSLATYTLPVVVHIIHNNGTENIPDATVLAGIQQLNDAYENIGYYDQDEGVNTEIAFCLAKQDPDGNATSGITRTVSTLTDMDITLDNIMVKDLIRWDPLHYINIWLVKEICDNINCGVAGYSSLPTSLGNSNDGVVVEAQWFGSSESNSAVTVHELGHYLGLYHTFQGGCGNDDCLANGDRVCDTPPDQSTVAVPCEDVPVNSCSTDVNAADPNNPFATDQDDMFNNYMDYGDLNCYNAFTQGQADRMFAAIENIRFELLESNACQDPCAINLTASFDESDLQVFLGETVTFTNTSVNATIYDWQIDGVSWSTATDTSYQFNGLGEFVITLFATNGDPNCTDEYSVTVEVICPAQASFTVPGLFWGINDPITFSNTSINANEYEWFIDDVSQGNTFDLTTTFTTPGLIEICLNATDGICATTVCQTLHVVTELSEDINNFYKVYGDQTDNYFGDVYHNPFESAFYCVGNNNDDGGTGIHAAITKLDACGNIIWSREYAQNASLNNIVPTDDGNFLVHGRLGFTIDNTRIFVAKINPSGDLLWDKTYYRTGRIMSNKMVKSISDPNGESYYIKHWKSPGGSSDDIALMKIDGNGDLIWSKDFLGTGDDQIESIVALPGGGVAMIGASSSMGWDGFVTKLDTDGDVNETYRYNASTEVVNFRDGLLLSDGGMILCGYLQYTSSDRRAFVMRIDEDGEVLWSDQYNNNSEDIAHSKLVQDIYGNIYVAGNSSVNGEDVNRIHKYDLDGNLIWAKKIGELISATTLISGALLTHTNTNPDRIIAFNRMDNIDGSGDVEVYMAVLDTALISCETVPYTPDLTDIVVTKQNWLWDQSVTTYTLDVDGSESDYDLTVNNICEIDCSPVEICDNGLDDDGDGLVDCFDPDCCGFCDDNYYNSCPEECQYDVDPFAVEFELKWQSEVEVYTGHQLAVGDLDGDGIPEILTGNADFSDAAEMYILDGETGVVETTFILPDDNFLEIVIAIGDVDTDGTGEIFLYNRTSPAFKLYRYEHDGTLTNAVTLPLEEVVPNVTGFTKGISLADFDQDGSPELFFENYVVDPTDLSVILNIPDASSNGGLQPVAADVLPNSFCPNCEGLELVCGNEIYSVDIDAGTLALINSVPTKPDGHTSIVDFDQDGDLDAVVSAFVFPDWEFTTNVYVWDLQTNTVMNEYIADDNPSPAMVSDIDGDNELEIVFKTINELVALDHDFSLMWSLPIVENFWNTTTPSSFDFDGNGAYEIVDQSEDFLRVIDGTTGVVSDLIESGSVTAFESPIIADIDGDGTTEILISGANVSNVEEIGFVRAYRSATQPWLPTRKVWNQYGYFNVNVNDDLSIPTEQQLHHIVGDSMIMNNFFTQYSNPNAEVADAIISIPSFECDGDSVIVTVEVCNVGANILSYETPVSFYSENPLTNLATLLGQDSLAQNILPDSCLSIDMTVLAQYGDPIYVVVNDDNSVATPFSFDTDFPVTYIAECDYSNNMTQFLIAEEPPELDLGPDINLCDNGVFVFNAGDDFISYEWQDGSIDSTFTAYDPGEYWVTVFDGCGYQTDTVEITEILPTVAMVNPMTALICPGDTATFTIDDEFDSYQWVPSDFLDCDTCVTVHANPDSPTMYQVIAHTLDGCYSVDTVFVEFQTIETQETVNVCAGGSIEICNETVMEAGAYPCMFTSVDGCDSTHTVNVIIDPPIMSAEVVTICNGDSFMICGSDETSSGDYPCTFTAADGCDSLHIITLIVEPTISVSEAVVICDGDSYSICGTNVTTPGDYPCTFMTADGCDSIHIISLSFYDNIDIDITSTPTCPGDNMGELTATASGGVAPYDYLWDENNQITPTITELEVGTYTVTVTDANNCTNIESGDVGEISINANLESSDPNCNGLADGIINISNPQSDWTYSINDSPFGSAPVFTDLAPGDYTVVVMDADGCLFTQETITLIDPDVLEVTVPETFVALDFEGNYQIETNVNTNEDDITYMWSANSPEELGFLSCTDCPNPIFTPPSEGSNVTPPYSYVLNITTLGGCLATTTIYFEVPCNINSDIPNAFTPNRDGTNDDFGFPIGGAELVEYIRIYDRWGQKIFEGTGSDRWDGTRNGKDLTSDVYVYIIKVTCETGGRQETEIRHGDITLIR